MSVDLNAALRAVDQLRRYERELLNRLVACRSVRGEPSEINELCADELHGMGMDVELVAPQVDALKDHTEWCPPHPAVAAPEKLVSVVGSRGEGPGIFLFAHIDTEDPQPRVEWRTDPHQVKAVGDRLYGVGTADDKAGVVSVVSAVRALLSHLEGKRVVVGLVHGKLGGGLGTLPVMAAVGEVDASIYCHPAETGRGLSHFKTASHGYFTFRIETAGRRPDPVEIRTPASEDPRLGVNAATRLRRVLDAVDRWAVSEGVVCSVNRVAAGDDPRVLPESAVADGAVWFRAATVAEVYQSLQEVALEAGAAATQLFGLRSNPAQMRDDHPLVTATAQAIAAETGAVPERYSAHVASDIRFPIRCLNAATVGFGALGGNFYGSNEWVDAEDMHRATRVIIRLVSAWAARDSKGGGWPNLDSKEC